MTLNPNLRGALFMTVAMAGFTINDAIVKLLVTSMNAGQIMLVRGIFASVLIGLLTWQRNAFCDWRLALHPTVLLRVGSEVCATLCIMMALMHLPLANVAAVLQALPLAVTMGAALFFGEQVGMRRWLAIGAGFVGVTIILRPGFEGFNSYALLVLLCVAFCVVRDLSTRRIPAEISSLFLSTATSVAVMVTGGFLIVPLGGWTPLSTGSLLWLIGASVLLIIGYQFVIVSLRAGDISFVAPFRYTALVWAVVLGILMFGDFPDMATWFGSAIIVGSGIYTIYRERRVRSGMPAAHSAAAVVKHGGG